MTRITARDRGRKPGTPVKQTLEMPGDWRSLQDAQLAGDNTSSSLLVPNGAGWVEHDSLGVAEEVARRWPNLRVAECQQRCKDCVSAGHYPFVVCEVDAKGRTVPVLGFLKMNREIVDTLWAMSNSHDQQKLADEHNNRVRAEIRKAGEEQQKAALEIIGSALQSSKYGWKGPGGIKIDRNMTPAQARRVLQQ